MLAKNKSQLHMLHRSKKKVFIMLECSLFSGSGLLMLLHDFDELFGNLLVL